MPWPWATWMMGGMPPQQHASGLEAGKIFGMTRTVSSPAMKAPRLQLSEPIWPTSKGMTTAIGMLGVSPKSATPKE